MNRKLLLLGCSVILNIVSCGNDSKAKTVKDEQKLNELSALIGAELPPGTVLINEVESGRGPDSGGLAWGIKTQIPFSPPGSKESKIEIPIEVAVPFVELITGAKAPSNPRAAFSNYWDEGQYHYRAVWVRFDEGDHIAIEQFNSTQ